MPSAGAAVIAPFAGVFADRFGRKGAMLVSSLLCLIGAFLQTVSVNSIPNQLCGFTSSFNVA